MPEPTATKVTDAKNDNGAKREVRDLGGPPGRIRSTWQLMAKPFETYERWQEIYGDTFLVKALNGNVVVTCNAENIRRVLAARHDEVSQFAIGTLSPLIGEQSVILVNGERHRRARSMLMPPFHGDCLRGCMSAMQAIATRVSDGWSSGDRIKVMDASLDYSLEVIIEIVFGVQDLDRVQVFKSAIKEYVQSFRPMFAFTKHLQRPWIPAWNRFQKQKRLNDQLLNEQIAEARNHPDRRLGVLSMLLASRDEAGQPLSDEELKQQLITLLFAGHETTQIAIGWAMSWLHRTPEVLQRLRNEMQIANSLEELVKSDLLHGICQESLRLNVIVPDFLRVIEKPMELEDVELPKGSSVGILSCRVHADPTIYREPGKFDPDRWAGSSFKPHEFLAFGGGVRRCIGSTMALMEMKIALVTWLRKFEFDLPSNAPKVEPVHRRNLTMAPRSGIPLLIRNG